MLEDFKDLLPYHVDLFLVMENHVELAMRDVKNREYHKTIANSIGRRLYRAIVNEYDEHLAELFAKVLRDYIESRHKENKPSL